MIEVELKPACGTESKLKEMLCLGGRTTPPNILSQQKKKLGGKRVGGMCDSWENSSEWSLKGELAK